MKQARTAWVDAAKGIGIILVVLTHIWIVGQGPRYIMSFHMPLFFLLSGYLFAPGRYDTRSFIMNKARMVILPYFVFSSITYTYWLLIERKFSGNGLDPLQAFWNIFLSQGGDHYLPHNPALWFLPCLFLVAVVFLIIERYIPPKRLAFLLLGSVILGYMAVTWMPNNLPWDLDVVPIALVFYGVGYACHQNARFESLADSKNFLNWAWVLLGLLVLGGLGYTIAVNNGQVGMASNHYGNYFLFWPAAFLGIGVVAIFSVKLAKVGILNYLGRNSLIIFGLHFPVKRVVMALTASGLHTNMDAIRASFWLSSLDTLIVLLLMVPVIYVFTNYLPFAIGRTYQTARDTKQVYTTLAEME